SLFSSIRRTLSFTLFPTRRSSDLVLDEPMTGLDLTSMRIIDDVIHAEVEEHGHSVILTTHDLDEAAAADHVILMDGKVVASTSRSEEHTSELQSRFDLVCRLLLEK